MCVLGGVMEINGVRSKGAIRTMEGSKRVGGGGGGERRAGAGLPGIP